MLVNQSWFRLNDFSSGRFIPPLVLQLPSESKRQLRNSMMLREWRGKRVNSK